MATVTACTLDCPDACSLIVDTDETGEVHIRGNPDHPITNGFMCSKMRRFGRRLQSPNRIRTPLLKDGSGWKPVTWDEALDLCAKKIQALRSEPSSILHLVSGADKGLMRLATGLFFAKLGTSRVGGCLCDDAGIEACIRDFGTLDQNDIRDLPNAARIVNWGKDLGKSSVHVGALVRKARKNGARVLTISPGGDENRDFSDIVIRTRPGTDRFLAALLIRLFIDRGSIRQEIVSRTSNWESVKEAVTAWPVNDLKGICDISEDDLEAVYSCYAGPEPTATIVGFGTQRYAFGGENVRFINALAMISGNVGVSGGGSYYGVASVRNVNRDWSGIPYAEDRRVLLLPTIGRDILNAKEPPVKMLWVTASNIVNQAPDSHEVIRAFESVDFKVVVDAFMTDTAERADLVLPCKLTFEKEDIVGAYHHNFVNYVRPVVQAPPGVKDDYEIVRGIVQRLDPPVELPEPDTCLREILRSPYLDTTLEAFKEKGFVEAKRSRIAFSDLVFDREDGKYRFPEALHPEPAAPPGYPFRLLTLIRKDALHSQILPEDHAGLPAVWVKENHPVLDELDTGRDVFLASPLGKMKVTVKTLPDLHPDAVVYRRDDWMKFGGGPNRLIEAGITDIGECAPFYQQYVRLEN